MQLSNYINKVYVLSSKYNICKKEVIDLIDFQEYKRNKRIGKSNLELSINVVDRYLKIKNEKYENKI